MNRQNFSFNLPTTAGIGGTGGRIWPKGTLPGTTTGRGVDVAKGAMPIKGWGGVTGCTEKHTFNLQVYILFHNTKFQIVETCFVKTVYINLNSHFIVI